MLKKLLLLTISILLLSGCTATPKKEYSFELEDFKKAITEVPLTKNNIFDYIDIIEESEEVYYEDINETYTETAITHRPKQDQLLVFEAMVTYDFSDYTEGLIEDNDILDTKEIRCGFTTYPFIAFKSFKHEDNLDLGWITAGGTYEADAINCDIIKERLSEVNGKVFILDIPEDKWYTDGNGNKYFSVHDLFKKTITRYYLSGLMETYDMDDNLISSNQDKIDQDSNYKILSNVSAYWYIPGMDALLHN